MAIWLRKLDLRDVNLSEHELGEEGISELS